MSQGGWLGSIYGETDGRRFVRTGRQPARSRGDTSVTNSSSKKPKRPNPLDRASCRFGHFKSEQRLSEEEVESWIVLLASCKGFSCIEFQFLFKLDQIPPTKSTIPVRFPSIRSPHSETYSGLESRTSTSDRHSAYVSPDLAVDVDSIPCSIDLNTSTLFVVRVSLVTLHIILVVTVRVLQTAEGLSVLSFIS